MLSSPHRKPPHHFRQRNRLTLRRIRNATRHRNHDPLPSCPIKPSTNIGGKG
ncbi:hypothetical protein [Aulosira sp. FACHB-615]|uniref:hypothetical protein n=1 Tax=Aulosira sp. FACHB-615 TaxID=2692777 RepID=UPI0016846CE5|nr:hypothetical protein [Aulosira sp. FACHB-615]MBD2491348.1 hypothetical protein [Aulosira sp. FACHB-615]